jgi:hypothetical protein
VINVSQAADPAGLNREVLDLLVGMTDADGRLNERRNRDRFPIGCGMQLVPIGTDGEPLGTESIVVFARDLSTRGISFSHEITLPTDRVLLAISLPQRKRIKVEAKIMWTRHSPLGLYESGGPLIRKVDWID